MRKYRLVAKKGEGTFSEVLKAQNVKDGRYHAIKCMKNRFDSIDQVNNLREIQALRRLSPHEHVITLEEVLYDQPTGRLALVFELMDANLYELIRGRRHYLNPQLIKSYMWQLMKALDHMHKKGIFHRDIKPENILIESSTEVGRGLKLADFGSCRGIYSKQPYTEYISTRWYRAPECLLTDGYYGPEMDLWGAGCVMFEITSLYPLFPGSNEVDQISRIHKVLGTPSAEMLQKFRSKGASHISFDFPQQKGIGIPQLIPHASPECVDLIVRLLKYDATERITAREAMRHVYFRDVRETETRRTSATTEGAPAIAAAANAAQASVKAVGQAQNAQAVQGQGQGIEALVGHNPAKAQGQGQGALQSQTENKVQPSIKALPSILGPSATNTDPSAASTKSIQQSQQQQKPLGASAVKGSSSLVAAGGGVSGGSSSLPPIGGVSGVGATAGSNGGSLKFGASGSGALGAAGGGAGIFDVNASARSQGQGQGQGQGQNAAVVVAARRRRKSKDPKGSTFATYEQSAGGQGQGQSQGQGQGQGQTQGASQELKQSKRINPYSQNRTKK